MTKRSKITEVQLKYIFLLYNSFGQPERCPHLHEVIQEPRLNVSQHIIPRVFQSLLLSDTERKWTVSLGQICFRRDLGSYE